MATTNINIRVDSDIKSISTDILNSLGLDMTTAINIYLRQIIECNGIPFQIQKKSSIESKCYENASDEEILSLSKKLMDRNSEVYKELAK